ncbi:D-beta-hydroxybutyrate dehydrogenase [Halalkalibacter wakoensis JCM 9140]|uniref:D-beta-hydroxybutyrate dehydrogenase n=1 Tax=Halalkalibacter wakoensis JCM 9140 TaxID=1236970 RepID=W4Q8D8_9BACI|nr:D-beta-hydroxybutyrate dehydrogenase [Halalkalibacter wakoensis JCM 9140]
MTGTFAHLYGVFLVAQAAIKEFLKAGSGVIVNTASMYGLVGSPGSAAKAIHG